MMNPKKINPRAVGAAQGGANQSTYAQSTYAADSISCGLAAQRARLLAYLRNIGPITTLQARDELSIMHPAARMKELKEAGHAIQSLRRWDTDAAGNRHWQGLYVLLSGKGGAV